MNIINIEHLNKLKIQLFDGKIIEEIELQDSIENMLQVVRFDNSLLYLNGKKMIILDLFNLNLWESLDFKLTGISSNEEYEECEEEFERSF